jgi:hypothetical protein
LSRIGSNLILDLASPVGSQSVISRSGSFVSKNGTIIPQLFTVEPRSSIIKPPSDPKAIVRLESSDAPAVVASGTSVDWHLNKLGVVSREHSLARMSLSNAAAGGADGSMSRTQSEMVPSVTIGSRTSISEVTYTKEDDPEMYYMQLWQKRTEGQGSSRGGSRVASPFSQPLRQGVDSPGSVVLNVSSGIALRNHSMRRASSTFVPIPEEGEEAEGALEALTGGVASRPGSQETWGRIISITSLPLMNPPTALAAALGYVVLEEGAKAGVNPDDVVLEEGAKPWVEPDEQLMGKVNGASSSVDD